MGLVATSLCSITLALALRNFISLHILLAWLITVLLSVVFRYCLLRRYFRHSLTMQESTRWRKWFVLSTALSGILWGAAAIFLLPAESIAHQAFLGLILGGMTAGAVVAYASVTSAFLSFILPILIPLTIRFFLIGDEIHLAMGAMSLLFTILIVIMGMQLHAMSLNSFKLLYENSSLVTYLAAAKDHAEKLNNELTAEIAERIRGEKELQRHREHLQELVDERTAELSETNGLLKNEMAERMRMEEALRMSEEHFRSLIENALDIITVIDSSGVILYESPSVERLMGYQPEELVGKDVLAYLHPEEKTAALERITRLVANPGKADKMEVRFLHANSSWRTLEAVGTSVVDEAKNIKIMINSRDITERKELEEILLRMQKLEALGILAGGLAHDFNNLLASIVGNIDLAILNTAPGDSLLSRLQLAKQTAFRARDLTLQLLTFSKGGEPIKKTINMREFIKKSVNFALPGTDIRCEFFFPEDLWALEGDEGQLNQALSNIIINADQSMPRGGAISVHCANVALPGPSNLPLNEGDYVKISIEDEGLGIAAEHREKIFDPYFSTKPNGSGLGLATCHSIIKKHGGHIGFESAVGKGATFTIYLPASPHKVVMMATEEITPIPGTGKLLLMDDEQIIQEVGGAMLRMLGYQVTTAGNGEEAIDLYSRARNTGQPFAAVIMDLTIRGGMGGKEAIEQLRQIDPQVKAIVSSGYSNDPIMANFPEFGFAAVLTKPYQIQDLSAVLSKILPASHPR